MKIKYITVTGADDSIRHSSLTEIAEEFPHAEFGILMSASRAGSRFPSDEWIEEVITLPESVRLSGHICGRWVREILMGQWPHALTPLMGRFSRWQLNTHGEHHPWNYDFLRSLDGRGQIIFQNDWKHNDLIAAASSYAPMLNVAALFDLSHGAGVLPKDWPKPIAGITCGYAGGLSPFNVAGQVEKISELVGDTEIWIDAETHLRCPESQFSLELAHAFIRNATL